MKLLETDKHKIVRSEDYNFIFDKQSGFFARWGSTEEDDPEFSPFGPEIADIEITTICDGIGNKGPCKFCYKANTSKGEYMSLETFKELFSILPKTTTQIAFGVDAKCESNPDTFKIMQHCRDNGVAPNITVANINDETADSLSSLCGAVAVSRYDDKDYCYDSVKRLTDRGMKQVNIHQLICKETLVQTYETIKDIKTDPRLEKMNALVFLSLKKKGRGESFNPLSEREFNNLINLSLKLGIDFGMDSCSATKMLKYIDKNPKMKDIEQFIEPCESGIFSSYFNTKGEFFPCSFMEGEGDWKQGIHYSKVNDFLKDIWFTKRVENFRMNLLNNKRSCPVFEV